MALTYSPPAENIFTMPTFQLRTVNGENWSTQSIATAPAKVIVFMCNHCPYVKAIELRLIRLAADLKVLNIPFVGICSNDFEEYPEDHPTELKKTWLTKNYKFDYLVDETQSVARQFGAVCTPDFFIFNRENILKYRGRLDDSWRDESKVMRQELKEATLSISNNEELKFKSSPSMGCSIKWLD